MDSPYLRTINKRVLSFIIKKVIQDGTKLTEEEAKERILNGQFNASISSMGVSFGALAGAITYVNGKLATGSGEKNPVSSPNTSENKSGLETLNYDTRKLQHEFKHAGDFGVNGNWNSINGEMFKKALIDHSNTSDLILKSTYRGNDVVVYINSITKNGTYYDLSGNFIGGWKFSVEQLQFHIENGVPLK